MFEVTGCDLNIRLALTVFRVMMKYPILRFVARLHYLRISWWSFAVVSTTIGISSCGLKGDGVVTLEQTDKVDSIPGLMVFSEDWTHLATSYWKRDSIDGLVDEIEPVDTLNHEDYVITEKFLKSIHEGLTVTKMVDYGSQNMLKMRETDRYARKLSEDIESHLTISFDYVDNSFWSSFLDSCGTSSKMRANKLKADSILESTESSGHYLCGTAYEAIRWMDVPFLPTPKVISTDSAYVILHSWLKH